MQAPDFWYGDRNGFYERVLAPAAALYAAGARLREMITRSHRAPLPVVCVGNLTAGGAGKTPTVIALAERLIANGAAVHIVTRGYGGALAGPVRVATSKHRAREVGDEPILLSRVAPTWVARQRIRGAREAAAAGADLVLMDDGLQNPAILKDLSFAVVDGAAGTGNGKVIPAGPLREPVARALARIDAMIIVQDGDVADRCADLRDSAHARGLPVLDARIEAANPAGVAGSSVVAFAGIGRPGKFFASLRAAGAEVRHTVSFSDHHPFTEAEMAELADLAARDAAILVTTEKDMVRIPPGYREDVMAFPVVLKFMNEPAVDEILGRVMGQSQ